MDALPTVLLKPGEADRIVAGHPWIYHNSILRLTHPAADGDVVQVKDHRQRFLGVGFFNSKSKINVRVLSPGRVEIDQAFFEERIRAAWAVRQQHLPGATSFRVVNAESDFLSGLIVDKYDDVLVVQVSALGMDRRKAQIAGALMKVFDGLRPDASLSPAAGGGEGRGEKSPQMSRIEPRNRSRGREEAEQVPGQEGPPHDLGGYDRQVQGQEKTGNIHETGETPRKSALRAILERSDVASRKFEGLAEASGTLAGELAEPGRPGPESVPGASARAVTLNGLKFEVDFAVGHKTGLYLDQQVNYLRVAELVPQGKGAQVLDAFCFVGGFGLHAARAGAAHVHLIDQSAEAIAAATRNAAANGLSDNCPPETINVFDWLKAQTRTGPHEKLVPKFDLIVLDPPSFTRNRAAVPDALRGYKEIHLRALKLLKPGGVLATFCCSHHVDAGLFQDTVLAAAYDSRHLLRRVAAYTQSPDHPIIPMIPETEYLKGFAFELIR
jgi:23S rRNA (cytosine1962-C5)-methyltransferase